MITIINGGTQGLGEAVARKLVADGAGGLLLVGRSADRGTKLASNLTDLGAPSLFLGADIASPEAPAAISEACLERFGRVDALVNVAAATDRATLFEDSPDHFDRQLTVNVKGPYFLIQAVARAMVDQGDGGSIVNIGSVTGHGGQTKLTSYAMSKGALTIMTKNLAFGLMAHGIRINQVNPGWMDTESEHRTQVDQDGAPENWLELAEAGRPMGRLIKPWEVANAVAFCVSPDSGLMTGNVIDIDQSVQGAGSPPVPGAGDTINP